MALVLPEARSQYRSASVTNHFEPPKVFDHRSASAAKDFDTLFGEGAIAVHEICDRSIASVCKTQRDHKALRRVADRTRLNFHRLRSRQESEKVDEVANFADDSPSALLGIVYPMIRRQRSRVHSVVHGQRVANIRNELPQSHSHGSESPIESNHH